MHNLPQRNSFVVLILLPRAEALGLQLPVWPDCPFQTTGSFGFKGRFEERRRKKKKTTNQKKEKKAAGCHHLLSKAVGVLREKGTRGAVQVGFSGAGL